MDRPNVLVIMTDEERYPPPYETAAVEKFRHDELPARRSLIESGLQFHRHYAGSTACLPSRATLFTGQYPSLHGASQTDGAAKQNTDPAMNWLDPDGVPTLGDWLRAGGYETHYRGKWHVSHADLLIPGTHEGLMASDENGVPISKGVDAYRRADRLDPYGFSGWIGREPHGANKADAGSIRDGVFAEQVVELFAELSRERSNGPWLAVASFVNPHDIAFNGFAWEQILGLPLPDDSVPDIPAAPSQSDSLSDRPDCQAAFISVWQQMIYEQEADTSYRRLYYYLLKMVDRAIGRVLAALEESGMAEDTVVLLTSDHGDLVGAHGGLMQKWYNAYDEAIRVPLVVKGPGVDVVSGGIDVPTSHVDLIPTLMGLCGIDPQEAKDGVAAHHSETHDLPGRDLSGVITGSRRPEDVESPLYFMTEDDVSRGLSELNMFSGKAYEPVPYPSCVESVIATLPTGEGEAGQLWKLNHYYERLDDWNEAHGVPKNPFVGEAAPPVFELHNLTTDPEERANQVASAPDALSLLKGILEAQREEKRLLPALRNP